MYSMENSILVVDDDTLMHSRLTINLEHAGHWRSRAASAERARILATVYPPEVTFLTARRATLDRVLGPELGADNRIARFLDLDGSLVRIKNIFAASVTFAAARWKLIWIPALFAVGVVLLMLAAPHWTGWVQALATYELPAEDVVGGWLAHLLFDPAATFNSLLAGTAQTWLNPAGQIDALVTLAIIVLAVASVAGLMQLLDDEHVGFSRSRVAKVRNFTFTDFSPQSSCGKGVTEAIPE
jgi:hypothetical protein